MSIRRLCLQHSVPTSDRYPMSFRKVWMQMAVILCRKSMTTDLLMCLQRRISCVVLPQRLPLPGSIRLTSQPQSQRQHGLRKVRHCLSVMQHLTRRFLMPTNFMWQSRLRKSCCMTMHSVLRITSSPNLVRHSPMPKRMHSLMVMVSESLLVSLTRPRVANPSEHLLQHLSPMIFLTLSTS